MATLVHANPDGISATGRKERENGENVSDREIGREREREGGGGDEREKRELYSLKSQAHIKSF